MENTKLPPLMEYFKNIEDPRRETKNKKYPLIEVIVIAFLAVMSGADGWESIERYGVMRKKWLGKFLTLAEGVPKHDVYRRVLCAIRSELLENCFMNWVRDIKQDIKREVIAIDGKTVRGMATKSHFKAGTDRCKTDAFGKCMGNGEPIGVCSGTDRGKKQRNNSNTSTFGTDSDSGLHYYD